MFAWVSSQLTRLLDCRSVIHLVQNWHQGIRVYVAQPCLGVIAKHVQGETGEEGGLLIGRAYAVEAADRPLILIEAALPSLDYRNSAISLEMSPEVWGRADAALEAGRLIVGWYHSHPNLGAFFSSIDRATQAAFFNHAYSAGVVIDLGRAELKIFLGSDSAEYSDPVVGLQLEVAWAQSPR